MFDLLSVTLNEAWGIRDYVRQHDKHGQEWDREFNTAVLEALLEAKANSNHCATIVCTEEQLWQIDRQIPSALMNGTEPTGRNLLYKVAVLLVKMRGGDEDGRDPGPDQDSNTSRNSYQETPS